MKTFDPVSLGILWDRLISITDEIVSTLVRTSFSINVRESYDLSCVLFDADGNPLAQGTYSVPSFTGTSGPTIQHMFRKYPPHTLREGDVIATNDPWMGTGHLYDISVMRPVFRSGKLVGFTMSITHLPDIGGVGNSSGPVEIYEEGLRLPVCKLVREGRLDTELIDLIRTNVRANEQVIGDIMANISCNEVGGRLLGEFMDEYGIDDLGPLSQAIRNQSEQIMRTGLLTILTAPSPTQFRSRASVIQSPWRAGSIKKATRLSWTSPGRGGRCGRRSTCRSVTRAPGQPIPSSA